MGCTPVEMVWRLRAGRLVERYDFEEVADNILERLGLEGGLS